MQWKQKPFSFTIAVLSSPQDPGAATWHVASDFSPTMNRSRKWSYSGRLKSTLTIAAGYPFSYGMRVAGRLQKSPMRVYPTGVIIKSYGNRSHLWYNDRNPRTRDTYPHPYLIPYLVVLCQINDAYKQHFPSHWGPMAQQLTGKQQSFVDNYIVLKNATRAAEAAGYQGDDVTLASVGYENLKKPQIKGAIDAALSSECMLRSEALSILAELARDGRNRPTQLGAIKTVLQLYGDVTQKIEVKQQTVNNPLVLSDDELSLASPEETLKIYMGEITLDIVRAIKARARNSNG